jgi:acylphosphatase
MVRPSLLIAGFLAAFGCQPPEEPSARRTVDASGPKQVSEDPPQGAEPIRAHLYISGRVQGVGFRASTEGEARRIGRLVGWVKNLPDGRVEAVIQGPRDQVEKLVQWCRKGPASAEVTGVERKDEPTADDFKTFDVRF